MNRNARIEFLDGLRGLAIAMVVFFHTYARWVDLLPYGPVLEHLARYGWLGVQLFFLISGFVILMTLEKCSGGMDFIRRRWLRLFPGMLICSVIIFGSSYWLPDRPAGIPTVLSVMPGLLFVEPAWIEAIIGQPVIPLEGAFWSLYVEFKFYVFASAVYYFVGRERLVWLLYGLWAVSMAARGADRLVDWSWVASWRATCLSLSMDHFGWFGAGAALYIHAQGGARRWMIIGVAGAVACAISLKPGNSAMTLAALGVVGAFVAGMKWRQFQRLLEGRVPQFLGLISYPLYLLHENAIVGVVRALRGTLPVSAAWVPLLPIASVVILAYLVARFGEPALRSRFRLTRSIGRSD